MQLGFVSAILPEYSLDELLRFAKAEGFACVEAMCWPVGKAERKYAGVTHVDVTDFTQAKADDVLACCDRHGGRVRACPCGPGAGRETALVVGDEVDRSPDLVSGDLCHLQRFKNDPEAGERRVAVDE